MSKYSPAYGPLYPSIFIHYITSIWYLSGGYKLGFVATHVLSHVAKTWPCSFVR